MPRFKIETECLNVFYGRLHALKDVSAHFPERAVTVILGPSGCGKSTLLRALNRMLELIDGVRIKGSVLLDGVDIYHDDVDPYELRRRVGMVFQRPVPLPMSIYDNVAYGPRIHGVHDKRKLDAIVERCLRMVGLWDEVKDRLDAPAYALSGGQQQRLCIARALAVEPEVLLLDEPTASLDPASARQIEELVRSLASRYTIVMVTHDVAQARRVADYVIIMSDGMVVCEGPKEELEHLLDESLYMKLRSKAQILSMLGATM